ncbi:hypothetical protein GYMLUDRAFT_47480 [Collybiopsis luxurians FD-317 M1]|uniref:Uncharacterized protein n=1 Tax=Collybiopsis luxurians FD-317 M1 TaxID=944289 RepID=A0A0D0AZ93_9AGAR|nr:hypothetical protein GYMLUDRAFT_47480 [Collybiopsis luxurians FD-317 M1]
MRLTLFSSSIVLLSLPFFTASADSFQIPLTNSASSSEYDTPKSVRLKTMAQTQLLISSLSNP